MGRVRPALDRPKLSPRHDHGRPVSQSALRRARWCMLAHAQAPAAAPPRHSMRAHAHAGQVALQRQLHPVVHVSLPGGEPPDGELRTSTARRMWRCACQACVCGTARGSCVAVPILRITSVCVPCTTRGHAGACPCMAVDVMQAGMRSFMHPCGQEGFRGMCIDT